MRSKPFMFRWLRPISLFITASYADRHNNLLELPQMLVHGTANARRNVCRYRPVHTYRSFSCSHPYGLNTRRTRSSSHPGGKRLSLISSSCDAAEEPASPSSLQPTSRIGLICAAERGRLSPALPVDLML